MYTCAQCAIQACCQENPGKMPKNCPMRNEALMGEAKACYDLPENRDFYITTAEVESLGHCQWPRVKETIQLCLRMGYTKVGLVFCKGLAKEAKVVDDLMRRAGLNVVSVICKTGGMDKSTCGIPDEMKVHPGKFEPMCNPVAQAMLMNEQGTQFNVVMGLCVGHDTLFHKYSNGLCTTLVTKDRVLGHNPIAAIYGADGFFKNRIL